jgi:hypothetical protein
MWKPAAGELPVVKVERIVLHESFNPDVGKDSGTPKVFLPASGSFRGSEKLADVRKNTFGILKSLPTWGKILSGF